MDVLLTFYLAAVLYELYFLFRFLQPNQKVAVGLPKRVDAANMTLSDSGFEKAPDPGSGSATLIWFDLKNLYSQVACSEEGPDQHRVQAENLPVPGRAGQIQHVFQGGHPLLRQTAALRFLASSHRCVENNIVK
jgi:hypothetical protein